MNDFSEESDASSYSGLTTIKRVFVSICNYYIYDEMSKEVRMAVKSFVSELLFFLLLFLLVLI